MIAIPLFIGWWEIVIIAVVALVLLGGKKIPEFMRGVGEGVRGFKEGIDGVKKDIETTGKTLEKDIEEKK